MSDHTKSDAPPDITAEEIAAIRTRLRQLDAEKAELEAKLARLIAAQGAGEVVTGNSRHPSSSATSAPVTDTSLPASKIALIRSLFRGREDVFPKRWENAKSGKAGYAPACTNEWVRGICGKPKIKCSDCSNRAFVPVSDEAIEGHLRGRHVMGVYPLLQDEACRFLAADFDKTTWREDVTAFLRLRGARCSGGAGAFPFR